MNQEEQIAHVILARNGNTDSFCKLYELYYKDMYRFAYYMLGDETDAEDILSETVMDAFRGIKNLKHPDKFKSWIFKILTTKCRQQMAVYVSNREHIVPLPEQEELSTEEKAYAQEIDVRNAFLLLSEFERTIISLTILAGYSSREVARFLKRPEGTIRSIKSRALTKMSQHLKEDFT